MHVMLRLKSMSNGSLLTVQGHMKKTENLLKFAAIDIAVVERAV